MLPSYWIAHPTIPSFISAFSPEGVGQLLLVAADWPAGLYIIHEYHRISSLVERNLHWGQAVKDENGSVWIDLVGESS
jgi:hypothetical protein